MIFEKGLGTPKSKMVSEVLICFFRKSKVILNRLLGYVFSYIEIKLEYKFTFFFELPTSNFQLFYILYTIALIFIPAPTDAKIITSPLFKFCPSNSPFTIKSYKVGTVATLEFPNL